MLTPVILCGGSGTRLWPLSRTSFPKQFIDLGDGRTLFKEALQRAKVVSGGMSPYILTNEAYKAYAEANLYEMNQNSTIIVEPCSKNTAPAITAAAIVASQENEDSTLLVMPSDQIIDNISEFKKVIERGLTLAEDGYLVLFGIVPNAPETGFGYIERGEMMGKNNAGYKINKFIEKPKEAIAKQFLKSGRHYWNSGIFMFKAKKFIEEIEKYSPDILAIVNEAVNTSKRSNTVIRLNKNEFSKNEAISIDYAVMEQTENAAVVQMNSPWSDLGSWQALYESSQKDELNNSIEGDVISIDTENCYINSKNRLVATIGLRNLVVIETKDAVLVSTLERTQDVRKIVENLKASGRCEADTNPCVYRPWGNYESLSKGERFQVKRIIVNPGEELSLQKHHHRAEHWIVVEGSAEITVGDKNFFLTENQSTYIPVGVVHQLKNPGKLPLVVIEVQSGSYIGEDDIVRIADKYNRICI